MSFCGSQLTQAWRREAAKEYVCGAGPARAREPTQGRRTAAARTIADAEVARAARRRRAAFRSSEVGLQDFWFGGRTEALDVGGVSQAAADRSDVGFSFCGAVGLSLQSLGGWVCVL